MPRCRERRADPRVQPGGERATCPRGAGRHHRVVEDAAGERRLVEDPLEDRLDVGGSVRAHRADLLVQNVRSISSSVAGRSGSARSIGRLRATLTGTHARRGIAGAAAGLTRRPCTQLPSAHAAATRSRRPRPGAVRGCAAARACLARRARHRRAHAAADHLGRRRRPGCLGVVVVRRPGRARLRTPRPGRPSSAPRTRPSGPRSRRCSRSWPPRRPALDPPAGPRLPARRARGAPVPRSHRTRRRCRPTPPARRQPGSVPPWSRRRRSRAGSRCSSGPPPALQSRSAAHAASRVRVARTAGAALESRPVAE